MLHGHYRISTHLGVLFDLTEISVILDSALKTKYPSIRIFFEGQRYSHQGFSVALVSSDVGLRPQKPLRTITDGDHFRAQELCEQGGGPGLSFLSPFFPRS